MQINLPHKFEARSYQYDFFDARSRGINRIILIWNRRAGKDTSAWNDMICSAVEHRGIYYYFFPTAIQGRKVLWDGMNIDGLKFLHYIPKELIKNINNQEMKLTLINGSLIQVVGTDKYDSIMGTNPTGCIFSEYSLQNPNAWQYIRPIIDANPNGWAVFVFTPRGSNHAKELYDRNKDNPKWFCQLLTNDDTHVYPAERIAEMRKDGMSEDMIQQELYCSFTLGIQGSYYAKYLEEMRDEDRITHVPYDKHKKVFTSWDLGYGDSTSIIFAQIVGNEIHLIDYYESSGKELAWYAKILADKPYLYDRHFAPHDVDAHEMGTGLSIREVGSGIGIQFTVLPTLRISHEMGIECARSIYPRLWIDSVKCDYLVKALENYRSEYDENKQMYKPKPVHDKWSHAADSFRYLAIAVKRSYDGMKYGPSDEDVEGMMDKYNPIFKV